MFRGKKNLFGGLTKRRASSLQMTSRVSIVLPPSSMLHDENYGFTANHHHKFHEKYVFGRTLGTGGFSVVLAASLRDDTSGKNEVAVKVIDRKKMSQVDEAALRQEVEIMRAIDHPNICKMLDFYEEESHFYIILELIQGGELFDHLLKKNNYSESDAREMIDVIVNVVEYLHSKNIVHRDLKAENLLMMHLEDDAELKLCDFGASAYASEPTLTDTVGTPNYVAPEILQCQPYGKAVDIWAIGVITFLLLSGNYPFDDHNQIKLFTKIKKGKYDFHDEHWDEVSEEAKSFIRACLDINPETRLKAEDAYSHPWLQLSKHHFQVMNLKAKEKLRKFNWKRRATAAVTVAGKRTSELRRRRSGGRALLFANMPSSFDTGMHMGGMGGGGMGGGISSRRGRGRQCARSVRSLPTRLQLTRCLPTKPPGIGRDISYAIITL